MRSQKPGVRVVVYTCRTEGCRWENTGWPVQINPDGSIPEPAEEGEARGPKQFERPSPLMIAKNMEDVNAVADQINRLSGGGGRR